MAEFFKHEIAKWNVATDDLTLEQEAAYHRVVAQIRLYERPFKNNPRILCGLWRCNERRAKRLLGELIDFGVLTIEDGFIVDEKAVHDASMLRQSRVDKQSAGRAGGIESGKSRRKSLQNIETNEAPASTREEKAREEKNIGGGGSAREAQKPEPEVLTDPTFREKLLDAMGVDPSGMAGPNGKRIGTQADMIQVRQWMDHGLTENEILTEIQEIMAKKRDGPPKVFAYFNDPMMKLVAAKAAPPPDIPNILPLKLRGKSHENRAFDQAINTLADGFSAGTVHLDNSSRDPFAAR